MHLGATLRLLRVESGVSLRDLARRLGVSSAYLSRVENALDPVPTPERLEAIARELDVPPSLLIDAAHRPSPYVLRYAEQEPQAAALFLDIARRRLSADELLRVRRFVDETFPRPRRLREEAVPALAPLLEPQRVVLQLSCADVLDALEVASSRFTRPPGGPAAGDLAAALLARNETAPCAVGGGVAVPCATVAGAVPQATLLTLSRPLKISTPDGTGVSTVVVLLGARSGAEQLRRIAHVARLASRGLASQLADVRQPTQALRRIEELEAVL